MEPRDVESITEAWDHNLLFKRYVRQHGDFHVMMLIVSVEMEATDIL